MGKCGPTTLEDVHSPEQCWPKAVTWHTFSFSCHFFFGKKATYTFKV